MTIRLDHTIVPARDGEASARWFADLFALPQPQRFSVFWQVATGNGVDLDFDSYGPDGTFTNHHDGGRGVYFPSPDDHLFEIITVPYGGAGAK
jgi:catechol 2,3-dioxygenase-like lactoylglutathione lyase family enzyme